MPDERRVLTPNMLLSAYRSGIFPMAESRDDPELFWVDPRERGILPIEGFHISRSLAKRIRTVPWLVQINTGFDLVVEACAQRPGTWISHNIAHLYSMLHQQGDAHSIELWDKNALIGGVYGVASGTAFFGESMFSRQRDASKVALAYLTTHLANCGFTLFDTQFLTPHLASLGAFEVPRAHYQVLLQEALQSSASFTAKTLPTAYDVLQRRTQTS